MNIYDTLKLTVLFIPLFILHAKAQEKIEQDTVRVLKEVAVSTHKRVIKQQSDRIVYDLQADPESKGLSLLEIMRKVPYLSVDGDHNLLMKGNSSFKILINGKPSGIADNNLKELLKSIPANTIDRIEVITTPPSRYDAEGLAGMINIIMLKKTDNGYSGSLNLYEQFPAAGPGAGASFTLRQGKLGISGFGGASLSDVPLTTGRISRVSNNSADQLLQTSSDQTKRKSAYLGTELSYEQDSLNLISAQFNLYRDHNDGNGQQDFSFTGLESLLQHYTLMNNNRGNANNLDASLNYQLGFKADKNRLLTLSYRYSKNGNNQYLQTEAINYTVPSFRQDNHERSDDNTVQLDYVYPAKKVMVEAGLKGIFRNSNSDYQYLLANSGNGFFEPDPLSSDIFEYTQNVFSAYNSYALNLKSWSLQGGFRLEKTMITADFVSGAFTVKQDYLRLVPSFSASKNYVSGNSLNFGFSQRIKRPGINRLNPFVNRSNPNFETTGNPNLRPVLVNDLQAGYTIAGKLSLSVGFDYSFMNNVDLKVSSFNPATQITRTSFENSGEIGGMANFINISYPLTKQWNISLNSQLIYFWIEGVLDGQKQQNNLLTFTETLSSGYNFEKGWRANISVNAMSRNPTGFQGTSNGMLSTFYSVNKDLIKGKLSFAAVANNPLIKYRSNKTYTAGAGFYQVTDNKVYFSNYRLSLNYNFGSLKEKPKKNKREINNNDVSN